MGGGERETDRQTEAETERQNVKKGRLTETRTEGYTTSKRRPLTPATPPRAPPPLSPTPRFPQPSPWDFSPHQYLFRHTRALNKTNSFLAVMCKSSRLLSIGPEIETQLRTLSCFVAFREYRFPGVGGKDKVMDAEAEHLQWCPDLCRIASKLMAGCSSDSVK